MPSEGAKVVISDMNIEKCEETAAALNADGFMALSAPCDVTDEEAIKMPFKLAKGNVWYRRYFNQ